MFCLYCGNQLPDDAIFCNKCGKPQKTTADASAPSMSIQRNSPFPGGVISSEQLTAENMPMVQDTPAGGAGPTIQGNTPTPGSSPAEHGLYSNAVSPDSVPLQPNIIIPTKPVRGRASRRFILLGLAGLVVVALASGIFFWFNAHRAASNVVPCGRWVSPTSDGFVLTKGSPQMLIVKAYPCNAGDPAIIGVEFYIHEPASNGDYYGGSLCSLLTQPDPGTQDQYSCQTDGLVTSGNVQYVPSGSVQIGFWVSNAPNYGVNLTELTGTQS